MHFSIEVIYFTDAEGDFPEKKPEYPVFFVIPRECDECLDDHSEFRVEIPEWVNKLVL